ATRQASLRTRPPHRGNHEVAGRDGGPGRGGFHDAEVLVPEDEIGTVRRRSAIEAGRDLRVRAAQPRLERAPEGFAGRGARIRHFLDPQAVRLPRYDRHRTHLTDW